VKKFRVIWCVVVKADDEESAIQRACDFFGEVEPDAQEVNTDEDPINMDDPE